MSDRNAQIIMALNGLIETCMDGEAGFKSAAESVQNPELRDLFNRLAEQRGRFARELQAQVEALGGQPEQVGTLTGTLHRGWLTVKAVALGRDENSIIAACERAEESARQAYADALRGRFTREVRRLLQMQLRAVKDAHDRVRALELVTGGKLELVTTGKLKTASR